MTSLRSCSTCGSSNVQNLSMIYAAGTTRTQTSGTTLNNTLYGDGQSAMGIGSYQGSSVHQSSLAAASTPPDVNHEERTRAQLALWRPGAIAGLIAAVIGLFFIGSPMAFLTIFGVPAFVICGGAWLYYASKLGADIILDKQNEPDLDRWKRTFLCLSCGDLNVAAAAGQPNDKVARPRPVIAQTSQGERQANAGVAQSSPMPTDSTNASAFRFTHPGQLLHLNNGEWTPVGRTPIEVPRPAPGVIRTYAVDPVSGPRLTFEVRSGGITPVTPQTPQGQNAPPVVAGQGQEGPATWSDQDAMAAGMLPTGSYVILDHTVRYLIPGELLRMNADRSVVRLGRTPVEVPRPVTGQTQSYGVLTDDGLTLTSMLTHDGEMVTPDMPAAMITQRRSVGTKVAAGTANVKREANETLATGSGALEQLQQLVKMHQDGFLSVTEFEQMKARLLSVTAHV